jgi:hypothetical protein
MPSNRTIAQIKSGLLRPALTSHFEVQIPVGTGNLNTVLKRVANDTGLQDLLNISCSDASLPGSSIATFELQNDFTGVTERYAHRRMYDDRVDFTFYVDAERYLPIRFFEAWMRYVTGETGTRTDGSQLTLKDSRYHYRMNFPKDYRCEEGLKIIKFERDYKTTLPQHGHSSLEYEFVGAYPISVSSMPVSYDASNLLKCTVSMTYLRYVIKEVTYKRQQSKTSIGSKLSPQTSTLPQPLQKSSQANQNTGSQGQQSSSTSTTATPFNFTPSTNLGLGANAIPSSVQSGVT